MTATSTDTDRPWECSREAALAVSRLDAATAWMRTDMAAVMRLFVEQQNAYSWWTTTQNISEPNADMLRQWIQYFYGLSVDDVGIDTDDELSGPAQLMRKVLRTRAQSLRYSTIYLVTPEVVESLATLAHTRTYRQGLSDLRCVPTAKGHIVLPRTIECRRGAGEGSVGANLTESLSYLQATPRPDPIRALSWNLDDTAGRPVVRIADWIVTGDIGGEDGTDIDRQVAAAVRDNVGETAMPEMVWTNEWACTLPNSGVLPTMIARGRLQDAARDVAAPGFVRWDPSTVYDDTDGQFMVRLTQAVWDAVTAGLLTAHQLTAPQWYGQQSGIGKDIVVLAAPGSECR
ncbi:hypothetical protein [Rhodococcus baikonurensis]|uniref:Uncharacterized protein n=2 Tax=Bacteria TaxID=2 RepID=A0ABV5XP70_9NOCA